MLTLRRTVGINFQRRKVVQRIGFAMEIVYKGFSKNNNSIRNI